MHLWLRGQVKALRPSDALTWALPPGVRGLSNFLSFSSRPPNLSWPVSSSEKEGKTTMLITAHASTRNTSVIPPGPHGMAPRKSEIRVPGTLVQVLSKGGGSAQIFKIKTTAEIQQAAALQLKLCRSACPRGTHFLSWCLGFLNLQNGGNKITY